MPIATPLPNINGHTSLPNGPTKLNGHTPTPNANGHPKINGHSHSQGVAFTEARLAKPPSKLLQLYENLPTVIREKRQFDAFLQIDLAHLVMITEQSIIPRSISRQLFPVLLDIRSRGADSVPLDMDKGTLLLQVESVLASRLGEDVAGMLHTARSRIDQGATARRLFKRDKLLGVMSYILDLQKVLIRVAGENKDTITPTYTHLQHSQPGTFGHYLLSYVDKLHEDFQRCQDAFTRANRNPLGGVGLSGTSWPINRERTTELLGFDSTIYHSKLSREAFYAAEIAYTLSFVMATLNDLATDLHLFSSVEFGSVELDDSYCSTSSIFPQKKNPVTLEAIKANAGSSVNWGSTALATFRGEGTGDQGIRSVPLLDGAFETTSNMLELMGGIVDTLQVRGERMKNLLESSWCTSSNLADVLVRNNGLSFRQAHHVVARLVRICELEGVPRSKVTGAILERAAEETLGYAVVMSDGDLQASLDPQEFVRTRISAGSVGPGEVAEILRLSGNALEDDERWLNEKKEQIKRAEEKLKKAIDVIMG
ncbi:argininosuccinate lyase [Kwoniella bestiolae CBS 10118]|uniref:Arginosuccinase n=1 Tax=Kwoniella bestiolae CBS 10118 TaxID=1296100 RepID=A0A1B9GGD0_9TREE|nr:argininosuccinate lyase [Kwoniella bestiolae CBS 10118]OCF30113.1 argininosuccinate lyase [Kwoniella bestiolae CBS 10118]